MTESSANARHEGDEVESRISVTDRPRPHSRSRFLRSDSVCPDRRPTRRADADSHSQRRLLGGVELSWRRLRVLDGLPAVATRLWGNPCFLLLCVYRWCFALVRHGHLRTGFRRYTSHERLRAVGSHSLTCVGGGGVRWSQSESPCLGPRVAPPLITPHATATRVAAAASTTRFCSAARRGHWRAAAAPTAGTRAVSPVLQQQPHPCPRAVSPVASAASTSAPACSSDAQRRRGESTGQAAEAE